MSPTYEIRRSSTHGLGMFATCDLEAGDLILEEPIVIEVPKHGRNQGVNPYEMYKAFKDNPPEIQQQILQLTEQPKRTLRKDIAKSLKSLDPPERDEAIAVANKLLNNAFGNQDAQWLSIGISRINHSCVPNACVRRRGQDQTAHATRAIPEGEEITIAYCGSWRIASDRQKCLKHWNITCTCWSCSLATAESRQRDAKLMEIQRLLEALRKQETAQNYTGVLQLTENMPDLLGSRARL